MIECCAEMKGAQDDYNISIKFLEKGKYWTFGDAEDNLESGYHLFSQEFDEYIGAPIKFCP